MFCWLRNVVTALVVVVALLLLLSLSGAASASSSNSRPATARVYIGYCPSYFSGGIAVVDVDVITGKWTIVGTANPHVFGCVADYAPTFAQDPHNDQIMWMDFTSDVGHFVKVETTGPGNVTTSYFNSKSEFFTGFVNFHERDSTNSFEGLTGTVTQSGFCSDGCIAYGWQQISGPERAKYLPLPFKAISDDTSFIDKKNHIYYVQASHDLRAQSCAPESWQDCLLAIDTRTGQLLNSTFNKDEHVYRFGIAEAPTQPSSSSSSLLSSSQIDGPIVDAFVVGMNERCNRSTQETSYAFARVNLARSSFDLISCASTQVVIQEDPWVSSFGPGSRYFCTSSGNGDGEDPQFLTYEVATGNVVLNTKLKGLAQALKAKMGLIFVWAATVRD